MKALPKKVSEANALFFVAFVLSSLFFVGDGVCTVVAVNLL